MKYLIVTYSDFSYLHGQNIRAYYFIKELIKQKEEVHLIVIKNANIQYLKKIFSKNIHIHKLKINISRFNKFKLFQYGIFFIEMPFFLKSFIRKIKPHFVYAQNLLQGFSVALIKKQGSQNFSFIYDIFDLYFDFFRVKINASKYNLIVVLLKKFEKITLNAADMIFTISKSFKQYLSKNFKIPPAKIFIIYEGTDFSLFNKREKNKTIMKKYNLSPNSIIITFIGGIEKHDGLDSILLAGKDIIKINKNVKFLFVGKGGYLKTLIKKATKLDIYSNCIFIGWVTYNSINSFLSITDIALLPLIPSDSTNVIVTTKLYEYLAAGKVVIAPKLSGIKEIIIDKKTGLLFTPDNFNNLKNKLIYLIKNPSLRSKISANGYYTIKKNYNINQLIHNMYNLIKNNLY